MSGYQYYDNLLKGSLGRDLVKTMLEESGYTVCPYGWEDTLLDAMRRSKDTLKESSSNTERRIRRSPDLLVYDTQKTMMLVEVKARSKSPLKLNPEEILTLKEFWSDTVLVVVVPEENAFYAQRISELEIQQNSLYPLSCFAKLQDVFTKVRPDCVSHYARVALKIFGALGPEGVSNER